jgi:hypothetical protein
MSNLAGALSPDGAPHLINLNDNIFQTGSGHLPAPVRD